MQDVGAQANLPHRPLERNRRRLAFSGAGDEADGSTATDPQQERHPMATQQRAARFLVADFLAPSASQGGGQALPTESARPEDLRATLLPARGAHLRHAGRLALGLAEALVD